MGNGVEIFLFSHYDTNEMKPMIKKLVQVSVAVFCAMSGFRGAAAEKAATVGRPNFVLCMADDQPPSPPNANT